MYELITGMRDIARTVSIYRPIDQFMVQVIDQVDYIKPELTDSIILTVHIIRKRLFHRYSRVSKTTQRVTMS